MGFLDIFVGRKLASIHYGFSPHSTHDALLESHICLLEDVIRAMQQAYVLVNAEPGALWDIASSALTITGVKMAHAVTGFCDVIVYAEIAGQSELGDLIHRIRSLGGVLKTQTSVALPLPSYQL